MRFLFILIILPNILYSSPELDTDSLINAINKQRDTVQIRSMILLAGTLIENPDEMLKIANEILELSNEYNYDKGKISANSFIAKYYEQKQEYKKALMYHFKTEALLSKINKTQEKAVNYKNIGKTYFYIGKYFFSLQYYLKALKIFEEEKNILETGNCLANIGMIYDHIQNTEKALFYYNKALKICKENKKIDVVSAMLNNIGGVYLIMKDYPTALKYYKESLEIDKVYGTKKSIAQSYNNIGAIYHHLGDYLAAEENFTLLLKYTEEDNDFYNMAIAYHNLGGVYLVKNNYKKAEEYFKKALKHAIQTNNATIIPEIYYSLSELYDKSGKYKLSLEYVWKYIEQKDSLINQENIQQIADLQTRYETETKEKEIVILKKEKENDALRLRQTYVILFAFILGFIVTAVLIFFVFKAYRQKKRLNKILEKQKEEILEKNEELQQQKEEISSQRDEIEKQRDIATRQRDELSLRKKEITDSITYAKNIQKAILQNEIILNKFSVIDNFILLKPRDIVSGDFYWVKQINWKSKKKLLIAAADCTGHGVPGAFMSMLGTAFLNEIFNKYLDPQKNELELSAAEILNQLRDLVILSLHQSYDIKNKGAFSSVSIKDGMDIALCILDLETFELQFAGANNPIYVSSSHGTMIQSNGTMLTEIKGDKQPIGIHENMRPFTNNILQLNSEDTFYIFSDGYADQFGGPKGKKFMYKRFKNLLETIQNKTMFEQKNILNQTFESWRGTTFYVDDVLVMGFKINNKEGIN